MDTYSSASQLRTDNNMKITKKTKHVVRREGLCCSMPDAADRPLLSPARHHHELCL